MYIDGGRFHFSDAMSSNYYSGRRRLLHSLCMIASFGGIYSDDWIWLPRFSAAGRTDCCCWILLPLVSSSTLALVSSTGVNTESSLGFCRSCWKRNKVFILIWDNITSLVPYCTCKSVASSVSTGSTGFGSGSGSGSGFGSGSGWGCGSW